MEAGASKANQKPAHSLVRVGMGNRAKIGYLAIKSSPVRIPAEVLDQGWPFLRDAQDVQPQQRLGVI
ncbi:hypothetical protein CERZMDRAFT_96558 [Cercospora zeae-maydis SCOH1-5]|uniref:Uncharacterized protein n=1 Tax=Cercospora zeae-maydis SCOH1-5 TaxID=717836 RepID=A0A6A6FJW3_9PEZI|nr:hypothetical protein CERZMDRAFT_96558 [Cercospora zeae-maydis SCOH1-5]